MKPYKPNGISHSYQLDRPFAFQGFSLCRMGIPVTFCDDFGDLYQNKRWVICNNLNQFAHLSFASGPSTDVIKMAAIMLLMYTYKITYLKQ